MQAPKYSTKEAEEMAHHFFAYNYHDRGLLKWQGFFLSDHTSALRKQWKKKPEAAKPQLSMDEIGKRLSKAWQRQIKVHVQLNQLDGNHIINGFDGTIGGYDGERIAILSDNGKYRQFSINDVRWVSLV